MKTMDEVLATSIDKPAFSNGDEGCGWMYSNCHVCRNDRSARDDSDDGGCPIINVAMLLDRTPLEFERRPGGGYRCAEFAEDNGVGDHPEILDLPDHVEVNNGEWLLPVDAKVVAPGLAITAAINGVENGMYRMVLGRYTLTHIPTAYAISGAVKHLCARHIQQAVGQVVTSGVDWDRPREALIGDPAAKAVVGDLARYNPCDHRCDDAKE